ncbi:flagellar motor protein MotS [Virgibacillus salexigens]|uniref:Chemotaxis protein MotB n=1 Tax=Virgibacillus massiliensis TaxID=1462526 RepID=A0A024QBG7_9BACI|nr:flagellar motor protein MotS [Virgibacillus massiliensis]CDQ39291.1 Chemotaxis protein MotB [Virgibacillus massiliensis]
MKRRQIRKSHKTGAPKWMVTYSDMVTLILVFFILLFSMSQIDLEKFEAISKSFRNDMIFDSYPSLVPLEHPSRNQETETLTKEIALPSMDDLEEKSSLDRLMQEVNTYLNDNNLNEVIAANRTDQGVELILQERILFASGEAEILDEGKPFLDKIGSLLLELPNHIYVEGHTDNRPIANYRYPSNWELSGARASSVIRYLLQENNLDSNRFSSVGYADTQPIVPNDSADNWSKNRRVEIVILELEETIREGDNQ